MLSSQNKTDKCQLCYKVCSVVAAENSFVPVNSCGLTFCTDCFDLVNAPAYQFNHRKVFYSPPRRRTSSLPTIAPARCDSIDELVQLKKSLQEQIVAAKQHGFDKMVRDLIAERVGVDELLVEAQAHAEMLNKNGLKLARREEQKFCSNYEVKQKRSLKIVMPKTVDITSITLSPTGRYQCEECEHDFNTTEKLLMHYDLKHRHVNVITN